VFTYKLSTGVLERLQNSRQQWHSAVAAAVFGYFVLGENNYVNIQVCENLSTNLFFPQINLYLLSRILVGLARTAVNSGVIRQPPFPVFPLFAATVWGVVLWLFEYHTRSLQPSLQQSMTYLYHDSDNWTGTFMDFIMTSHSTA
jgi:peroxisomal membrane protein 4